MRAEMPIVAALLMGLAALPRPAYAGLAPTPVQEATPPLFDHQIPIVKPAKPDIDPFAPIKVEEGDTLPPLKCMKKDAFEASVKSHGGSRVLKLSALQTAFWRGSYQTLPQTAPGFPIGDDAVLAVKPIEESEKNPKGGMMGVVAFTMGDYLICNWLPVGDVALDSLFKVGGATSQTY